MQRIIFVFVAFATICSVQSASAWGTWTHRLISHIADKHLEPEVKTKVEKYLGSPIIDHCVWMDRIRKPILGKKHPDHEAFQVYRPSIRWHGVTVDENFLPSDKRSKKGGGAMFPNLEKCVENLRDYRNLTDSAVAVNLKFVIHMLQDMHCPGHIFYTEFPDCFEGKESGRKGRAFMPVYYNDKKTTFHVIWDGLSVRNLYPEFGKDYELFSQQMDTYNKKQRAKMCRGKLSDWLSDAGRRCRPVYDNVEPNDYLDREYIMEHKKVTEGQVVRSAYRIAHLLNEIFR